MLLCVCCQENTGIHQGEFRLVTAYDSNLLPDKGANRNQPVIAGRFLERKRDGFLQKLHYALEFLLEEIKSFLDVFEILTTGEDNFT
jgi:hypothetical protein